MHRLEDPLEWMSSKETRSPLPRVMPLQHMLNDYFSRALGNLEPERELTRSREVIF